MKAFGSMISVTAKDSNVTQTVTLILVNLSLVKHMGRVCIPGGMVRFMMGSGIRGLSKGMVFGKV